MTTFTGKFGEWTSKLWFLLIATSFIVYWVAAFSGPKPEEAMIAYLILGGILIIAFGFVATSISIVGERLRIDYSRCTHGIRGGKTRMICQDCISELQVAKSNAEIARQQHEANEQFRKRAIQYNQQEIVRISKCLLQKIDNLRLLSPKEFENVVASLFKALGYEVEQTPFVGDGGKDAIAIKSGQKYLIECKKYGEDSIVGRPDLQKFFAAMHEENAYKGFFVTTSTFSAPAAEYANRNNIELIDQFRLLELMKQTTDRSGNSDIIRIMCEQCNDVLEFSVDQPSSKVCKNQHDVMTPVTSDTIKVNVASPRFCRRCGRLLRLVRGSRGPFWGCTGYPSCRFTLSHDQAR